MYACLYGPALLDLALEFSPYVEQTNDVTVLICIDPEAAGLAVSELLPDISRAGYEQKIQPTWRLLPIRIRRFS